MTIFRRSFWWFWGVVLVILAVLGGGFGDLFFCFGGFGDFGGRFW